MNVQAWSEPASAVTQEFLAGSSVDVSTADCKLAVGSGGGASARRRCRPPRAQLVRNKSDQKVPVYWDQTVPVWSRRVKQQTARRGGGSSGEHVADLRVHRSHAKAAAARRRCWSTPSAWWLHSFNDSAGDVLHGSCKIAPGAQTSSPASTTSSCCGVNHDVMFPSSTAADPELFLNALFSSPLPRGSSLVRNVSDPSPFILKPGAAGLRRRRSINLTTTHFSRYRSACNLSTQLAYSHSESMRATEHNCSTITTSQKPPARLMSRPGPITAGAVSFEAIMAMYQGSISEKNCRWSRKDFWDLGVILKHTKRNHDERQLQRRLCRTSATGGTASVMNSSSGVTALGGAAAAAAAGLKDGCVTAPPSRRRLPPVKACGSPRQFREASSCGSVCTVGPD